jgi:hypothetical protein
MQPESKPLSIPDFNPIPMKTIQTLTLTACCLLISFYSYSQNLQFNSAVFYEYGGGMADGTSVANVVTTGTFTVGANQVLKVTQVGGSVGSPDFNQSCISGGYILINDVVVGFIHNAYTNGVTELYFPTGVYNVGYTDIPNILSPSCTGEVKGYISGILYDIVP